MIDVPPPLAENRRFPWWIVWGALLLPIVYLPTLAMPFDFADDALLVYAPPPMPAVDHLEYYWTKVVSDFRTRGPFRPVAWAYWEGFGYLLGPDAFRWRLLRVFWAAVASASLLWLLKELGFRPLPSLVTGAVLMWNPFGNELWLGTTMPEGIAMPFALSALACAVRATRSHRPWLWDLLGVAAMIAALGCKNTFAALIPAQFLLRICPEGRNWRAEWHANGRRACLLALTIMLPIAHYVAFKLNPHPGQYPTTTPKLDCLVQMLKAVSGTLALDYIGAGLVMAATFSGIRTLCNMCDRHRGALITGLALFVCGIGIYLPIGNVAARYAVPAAWGAAIALATVIAALAESPKVWLKRLALAGIACGLLAAIVANLGRQDKVGARIAMLWEALDCVREQAPQNVYVGWWTGPGLDLSEGYHFRGHLYHAGRTDVRMPLESDPAYLESAVVAVSGLPAAPGDEWQIIKICTTSYWLGKRQYRCYIWRRSHSATALRQSADAR